MLSQQVDRVNEGWIPDWDSGKDIYSISYPNFGHTDFVIFRYSHAFGRRFLTFKSRALAKEFLETNIDLMRQAAVFLV
jgi:hypothetical protein